MRRPRLGPWLLAAAALLAASAASAETRRLAVVLANNAGSGARPPLRFAERDADRMAEVLAELGGVAPGDLDLLKGQPLAAVRAALERTRGRAQAWRQRPGTRVVVLFYFSGHSDGEALELGRERLSFAELRRWLRDTGADVRVAIVDSCKSGALLALKGGRQGPSFEIRLTDHLATTGEALITSSAADEWALESAELQGSFFSHHLISGLRGAADLSGDGRVTLAEAYQYAYARTVTATADTLAGPQHPGYDYRLSGKGDLVLAEIDRRSALLEVTGPYARVLVIDAGRDLAVAEMAPARTRRLGLRPGRYAVRAWAGGRLFVAEARLEAGQVARLDARAFTETPAAIAVAAKSGEPAPDGALHGMETPRPPARRTAWSVATGVEGGVAREAAVLPALRLGIERGAHPATLGLALARGGGPGFGETHAQLVAGKRLGLGAGRWRLLGGVELGGGVVWQAPDGAAARWTVAGSARAAAGARVRVAGAVWGTLDLLAGWSLLRFEDGGRRPAFLPSALLGVTVAPGDARSGSLP